MHIQLWSYERVADLMNGCTLLSLTSPIYKFIYIKLIFTFTVLLCPHHEHESVNIWLTIRIIHTIQDFEYDVEAASYLRLISYNSRGRLLGDEYSGKVTIDVRIMILSIFSFTLHSMFI